MITPKVETTTDTIRTVITTFSEMGLPAHLLGYEYLKTAVCKVLEEPNLVRNITKELYPVVAKEHSTTTSRAERAMRHAIEETFMRGDPETLAKTFGMCVSYNSGKMSNSEFIAAMAERIRLKIGAYDCRAEEAG